MTKASDKEARCYWDLNSLLQVGNLFIMLLILCTYAVKGENQYVDDCTIFISVVFALQNFLLLWWERKSREPLLLLLMVTVIPFYLLRVASLLYEPWSVVLVRFPFTPGDMNHAYLFIMSSVLAMSIGIKLGRGQKSVVQFINRGKLEVKAFALMLFVTLLDLVAVFGVVIPSQGFVSVVLNADILLILVLVAYALKSGEVTRIPKKYYWVLLIVFLVVRTLNGSRSALMTAAFSTIFVLLSLHCRVRIKRWVVIALIGILPLAFIGFSLTTFYRPFRQAKLLGVIDATPRELLTDYLNSITSDSLHNNLKVVLRPMFDRVGYLDMAADMITNRESYSAVINPTYYFKSVVDNVLTPGFDLFDTPRAGNNTVSIYNNLPLLKRSEIDLFYQSDMLTIFGEYYVLFGGYLGIAGCFLMGFFSKLLFESIRVKDGMWYHACRAVFYKLYVLSLWSFGLDWQVGDILFALISVASLYFIITVKLPNIFRVGKQFRGSLPSDNTSDRQPVS